MSIDLSQITGLTVQIDAMSKQAAAATDPTVKAVLSAQVAGLQAQLSATAQHMQAQADASSGILADLGLLGTLTNIVGTNAPTIIGLFK